MTRFAISFLMLTFALIGPYGTSFAASCKAQSTEHRVALLELFTSEGCNSCPPADRWLNSLRDRGYRTDQVVPLAFHVDYWDYIGWVDRFAQPAFSQRQRTAAERNNASVIYTPQFLFDGKDIRRPWAAGRLSEKLLLVNATVSPVDMSLEHSATDNLVRASLRVTNDTPEDTRAYVVLFENGLQSSVKAGENAGKRLYHEHVVRELSKSMLIAPGKTKIQEFVIKLPEGSDAPSLGLAAVAEDAVTGATMQTMATSLCDG